MAPLILNVGTRLKSMASFTLRPLFYREDQPVYTEPEAEWVRHYKEEKINVRKTALARGIELRKLRHRSQSSAAS